MRIDQESADPWDACPDGALVQMTRRLQRAQRRRDMATMLGASGVGVVLVAGILLAAGLVGTPSHLPGGLSCSQCKQHLAEHPTTPDGNLQLTADAIEHLPRSVRQHLAGCPRCREKVQAMLPDGVELHVARPSPVPTLIATK